MFRFEAEASGIGAGGVGAASPPPAAGAEAPPCPPQQLLQQLLQPVLQPVWQQLSQPVLQQLSQLDLQHLCVLKRRENKPQRFFLQHGVQLLQQLLQLLQLSQQAGSQQAGSQQAGSQQAGSQQAGSQQAGSQQLDLQQRSKQPRRRPNNLQRFLQQVLQPVSQQLLQLLHESQQAGSQQAGSQQAGSQQVGSQQAPASQQVGSQHEVSQHLVSQQPHPRFNIRLRRSNPKLWLQRPMLTTSAPKNMFHFIEQRLLCRELGRRAATRLAGKLSRHGSHKLAGGITPTAGGSTVAENRLVSVVWRFLLVRTAWVGAHSSQGYGPRTVEPFLGPIMPSRFPGAPLTCHGRHAFLVEGQLPYRLACKGALSTPK